ncbi:MAG: ribosome-associated translation inhibitor RaiA [Proteobacteria bacterium]|nr:MAG: ribosome-associated translation inhibitor RaiA [Pseudomonadota bacterium]
MMFQFYFKKMGSSETLKDLSQRKLSDLVERFVGANGLVRITFQTERNAQRVLCHLQGHNGQNIRASASSSNMYANLDAVAHKLESQLLKEKTKLQRTKGKQRVGLSTETPNLRLVSSNREPIVQEDDAYFDFEDYESPLRHIQ